MKVFFKVLSFVVFVFFVLSWVIFYFNFFFSLVDVLFLLCPWFSYGFFTRLRVLRRHPGILDFLSLLLLRCICSVFPIFRCFSMHLRPRGSVRIRRPEMMDVPFV